MYSLLVVAHIPRPAVKTTTPKRRRASSPGRLKDGVALPLPAGDGQRPRTSLTPPEGLRAALLTSDAGEVVLLSYPAPSMLLPPGLTDAEREVVTSVLDGKSNAAIAEERGRSVRTVANQVNSVFRKLGVASRAELVALCARSAAGRR